jgi:hypothetical protein
MDEIKEIKEDRMDITKMYTTSDVVTMLANMTGNKRKRHYPAAMEVKIALRKEAKKRIDKLRKRMLARTTEYERSKELLQKKMLVLNTASASGDEHAKWLLEVIERALLFPASKSKETISTIYYISSTLQATAAHEEAVRGLDLAQKEKAKI